MVQTATPHGCERFSHVEAMTGPTRPSNIPCPVDLLFLFVASHTNSIRDVYAPSRACSNAKVACAEKDEMGEAVSLETSATSYITMNLP